MLPLWCVKVSLGNPEIFIIYIKCIMQHLKLCRKVICYSNFFFLIKNQPKVFEIFPIWPMLNQQSYTLMKECFSNRTEEDNQVSLIFFWLLNLEAMFLLPYILRESLLFRLGRLPDPGLLSVIFSKCRADRMSAQQTLRKRQALLSSKMSIPHGGKHSWAHRFCF